MDQCKSDDVNSKFEWKVQVVWKNPKGIKDEIEKKTDVRFLQQVHSVNEGLKKKTIMLLGFRILCQPMLQARNN